MQTRSHRRLWPSSIAILGVLFFSLSFAACGDSGGSAAGGPAPEPEVPGGPPVPPEPEPEPQPEPQPEAEPEPECEVEFDSTFAGVQKVFNDNCVGCHGEEALGGLDLREGYSYDSLFEVTAGGSDKWLVHPGDTERSFLYDKIVSWTDDAIVLSGASMPPTGTLPEEEVNLVRFWIYGGAPRDVMIQGTEEILEDACLAPAGVFSIEALDPPVASFGVQMVMPPQVVAKASETETCMVVYEDFCDEIPDEYRIPDTNLFRYDVSEIRMPPFSHHLLLTVPVANFGNEEVLPSAFSGWACRGGAFDGQGCDPEDKAGCGAGRCATPLVKQGGCNGYEPANGTIMQNYQGTQQPQLYSKLSPGVFSVAPCRTVVGYNLHAFNLTQEDASITAQINFEFAEDPQWILRRVTTDDPSYGPLAPFGIGRLFQQGAEAYAENTLCTEVTLPQGAYMTGGGSHTHRLGARSTWKNPDGAIIYDSRFYNDPVLLRYEDPVHFPEEDPATRTFEFCTLYRNGIDENGEIDVHRLSRSSTRPYSFGGPDNTNAGCEPYRCINEGVDRFAINCDDGVANLKGDDAACDSSPGANDGFCDACSIRGGVTTQDEMYQGSLSYFLKD